ncbi:MAG: hypothetical protein AMK75_05830, partial [Planctomycetes bacterium SM23_65]
RGVITSFLADEKTGRYREVAGVLTGRVYLDDRRTVYTRHGDLFAWLTVGWVILWGLLRLAWWWVERYAQKRRQSA